MNAILLLVDTLRRDFLGCYGNGWIKTPNMDRLAARGTLFENAYLGSYPCMPARRDTWTGRYEFPWRGWGPLEETDPDVARLIGQANVVTELITDHYHLWERGSGNYHHFFHGIEFIRGQENDTWITDPTISIRYPAAPEKLARHARREESFERYMRNTAHFRTERDYFAPQVMQTAIDWLERNHTHERFFLAIDCFDPHEPFDPPYPYSEMYNPGYKGERVIWPTYGKTDYLTEEELKEVRALYAGELTMVDRWLGLLLDKMEQLGLMDNTMIVLITDHGHMLGEHGIMGKPWAGLADSNMYQELAHIPLILYHPKGLGAGKRIAELVQPVDIYASLLEWFGIQRPDGTHGMSLLPLLEGRRNGWRQVAPYGRFGEAINITDGEWTLFRWPEGSQNDPLYWYSVEPPRFLGTSLAGGLQDNSRYPVQVPRGDQTSALYNIREDYRQQENLYHTRPKVVAQLEEALVGFLRSVEAPKEQFQRLGLRV